MQKRVRFPKALLYLFALLCVACILSCGFAASAEETVVFEDTLYNSPDMFVHYDAPLFSNFNFFSTPAPEGVPTFRNYQKGDTEVNILFNFVNYENDTVNYRSQAQMESILDTFASYLGTFWDAASGGTVSFHFDYVTSVAPQSHAEYKAMGKANYTIENGIFLDAVNNSGKQFAFSTYQIKINVFSGPSGAWNTFLWSHAYISNGLIMLAGTSLSAGTLCHELGHAFGVQDLYAYTGAQVFACGYLDTMGSSDYSSINAYMRGVMGWLDTSMYDDTVATPIETLSDRNCSEFTLTLAPCNSSGEGTVAYKFGEYNYQDHKEFFVVEFRKKNYRGFIDRDLASDCVVVYRVNQRTIGNTDANKENGYAHIIYMGNQAYDVSSGNYLSSVQLTAGESIGSTGASKIALSYTGGAGKANTFSGENSGIVVTVNKITSEYAEISITFPEKEVVDYGNSGWSEIRTFPYNGDMQSPEFFVDSDAVTCIIASDGYDVGDFVATVSFVYDSVHYILGDGFYNVEPCAFTILPIPLTVRLEEYTATYSGTKSIATGLTYEVVEGIIYDVDEGTFDYSYAVENFKGDAGVYTSVLTISHEYNDYIITVLPSTYTILPRELTVTVADQTSVYGEELASLSCSVTTGKLVRGQTLNVTLSKEGGNDAGTYKITGVNHDANYNITFIPGTYTVTKANITAAATDTVCVYDGEYHFVDFSVATPVTYTVTYGLSAEDVTRTDFADTAFRGACEGLSCYALIDAGNNYNPVTVTASLTILPREVTVTLDDIRCYEHAVTRDYTYTVTGAVPGETPDFTVVDNACDEAGLYVISGTDTDPDYAVSFENGTLTVLKNIYYTVNYVLDGGTNSTLNPTGFYMTDTDGIRLEPASKRGYIFTGWLDENGNRVDELTPDMGGDVTLTAQYAPDVSVLPVSLACLLVCLLLAAVCLLLRLRKHRHVKENG